MDGRILQNSLLISSREFGAETCSQLTASSGRQDSNFRMLLRDLVEAASQTLKNGVGLPRSVTLALVWQRWEKPLARASTDEGLDIDWLCGPEKRQGAVSYTHLTLPTN